MAVCSWMLGHIVLSSKENGSTHFSPCQDPFLQAVAAYSVASTRKHQQNEAGQDPRQPGEDLIQDYSDA